MKQGNAYLRASVSQAITTTNTVFGYEDADQVRKSDAQGHSLRQQLKRCLKRTYKQKITLIHLVSLKAV